MRTAKKLSALAFELEEMGRNEDLTQADSIMAELETTFAQLQTFLNKEDWVEIAKEHGVITETIIKQYIPAEQTT